MENTVYKEGNQAVNEKKKKNPILEWGRFILLLLAIIIIIPNSIGVTKISGLSMYPTFNDGNIVLEEKISKLFSTPEVGDVAIINDDIHGYKIVKRIIGVGGDKVEINNGIVYVNDEAINEIMTEGTSEDMEVIKVPEKHIFIMGDNRNPGESIDSRDPSVGPVPQSKIDGYVLFSLIPFQSIPKPIELEE